MDKKIPITPFDVIKRMKDVPEILKWSRRKHLMVSGPEFWGIHHIYIDNSLRHTIFCLKADLTTHVFIGIPTGAKEWRKYDEDVNLLLSKQLNDDSLEWKIYKDLVLYKGKMLPPKEIPEEPYWGEVVGVETYNDDVNDQWIVFKIKELYNKYGTVDNKIEKFKSKIKDYKDDLFGITLFYQGTKLLQPSSVLEAVNFDKYYKSIMNRGETIISKAEEALKEVKISHNTDRFREIIFPPLTKDMPPIIDTIPRVKLLIETYNELFPGRDRKILLTNQEIMLIMNRVIKKF